MKIFYIIMLIFSASMIFLIYQSPYEQYDIKANLDNLEIKIDNSQGYKIADKLELEYYAYNIYQYLSKQEASNAYIRYFKNNEKYELKAKKIFKKDNLLQLRNDVVFRGDFDLNSSSVDFDLSSNKIFNNEYFLLNKNGDVFEGNSFVYDFKNKILEAKKVKLWRNL